MESSLSRIMIQLAPRAGCHATSWTAATRRYTRHPRFTPASIQQRPFTASHYRHVNLSAEKPGVVEEKSYSQSAANLSQSVTSEEKDHFRVIEDGSREQQMRAPWMREGSDEPPVRKNRSAGAMAKGKLITTPSRMLKIILPLSIRDRNRDRKDVEPLALLVHPQQPLSYLERLIQSELPPLEDTGKIPMVTFRAQDRSDENAGSGKSEAERDDEGAEEYDLKEVEETMVNGKLERTGKLNGKKDISPPEEDEKKRKHQFDDPEHPHFVRWSPSTEIGDFIQDAARAKEFAVDIEGTSAPIYVGVPSFADRTYYLRMRLRKTAGKISQLTDIKRECDDIAHRGAKRVAQGGFAALMSWWVSVYWLTFQTDLGWDVMEPVTYLVGLSGLIGGYLWFLYHNREVSYRSAMHVTVSRRQNKLYEAKGFDLGYWESLIEEGNRLRKEIKMVADEYDVEWDETRDEGDKKVTEALKKGRKAKNGKNKDEEDEEEEEEEEGGKEKSKK